MNVYELRSFSFYSCGDFNFDYFYRKAVLLRTIRNRISEIAHIEKLTLSRFDFIKRFGNFGAEYFSDDAELYRQSAGFIRGNELQKAADSVWISLCTSKSLSRFNSLSYRTAVQCKSPFICRRDNKVVFCVNDLSGEEIFVPVSYSKKYHGDIDNWQSEYVVCLDEKKRHLRFVVYKECLVTYSELSDCVLGVDVNTKNNLFYSSSGATFDYDREMIKNYQRFRNKIKEKKILSEGEKRLFQVWLLRIDSMVKKVCSELVSYAIDFGFNHIVMEDIKNLRYGLCGVLSVGSIKNIVRSICLRRGIRFTLVSSKYTSRMCNECGFISKSNRRTQERFCCLSCGHSDNADFNASKNLRDIGQSGNTLKPDKNGVWLVPAKMKDEKLTKLMSETVQKVS